jgi:hypothetical protein
LRDERLVQCRHSHRHGCVFGAVMVLNRCKDD